MAKIDKHIFHQVLDLAKPLQLLYLCFYIFQKSSSEDGEGRRGEEEGRGENKRRRLAQLLTRSDRTMIETDLQSCRQLAVVVVDTGYSYLRIIDL